MRDVIAALEADLAPVFRSDEEREEAVYRRMGEAFGLARIGEADLAPRVGYAFHNPSLEKLEEVYARLFGTEAAFIRPQLVSGTHALSTVLEALVEPGMTLLLGPGVPYETLHPVIGLGDPTSRSLIGRGVKVVVAEGEDLEGDLAGYARQVGADVVYLQRSRGYTRRPSLSVERIGRIARTFHETGSTVVVDNCYGEFVEALEPTHVGADVAVGSLIKNPGGTLAPTGSYVVGGRRHVARVAERLFGAALGQAPGPVPEGLYGYVRGLFLAPHLVSQAVQTTRLASALFQSLGYEADPGPDALRTDIVVRIGLGTEDRLTRAVQALQATYAVDGYARPEPAPLPGYRSPVLMASSGFIPGGTLDLSADAPLRPPFDLFLQGGISRPQARLALEAVAEAVGARKVGKSS